MLAWLPRSRSSRKALERFGWMWIGGTASWGWIGWYPGSWWCASASSALKTVHTLTALKTLRDQPSSTDGSLYLAVLGTLTIVTILEKIFQLWDVVVNNCQGYLGTTNPEEVLCASPFLVFKTFQSYWHLPNSCARTATTWGSEHCSTKVSYKTILLLLKKPYLQVIESEEQFKKMMWQSQQLLETFCRTCELKWTRFWCKLEDIACHIEN